MKTDPYPESKYAENPILDKIEEYTGDPTLVQKLKAKRTFRF
ncbi:hypothetical protein LEP1GSC170_3805 [Leptospira interrogans serovar Bataviae str. HAI135]|nr:hypothetical protein LEP1GSC170_3805 [Leptospira interrogans serovar Bataviae str. HAI135]